MSKLDLASLPTNALPSLDSAPISPQEDDPFVADLNDLFSQHKELRRLYNLALAENEQLRTELTSMRQGHGIQVVIEGRNFSLGSGLVTPPAVEVTNGHKTGLEDSFVL